MAAQPIVIGARSLMRQAYDAGIEQRERFGLRVSPFYNDRVLIRGQRVDITELLDAFFYAGFDGEPYPEQPSEVKHAMDPKAEALPAVERIAAHAPTERQDEGGASPESAAGPRPQRADPSHDGAHVENEMKTR